MRHPVYDENDTLGVVINFISTLKYCKLLKLSSDLFKTFEKQYSCFAILTVIVKPVDILVSSQDFQRSF